MSTTSDYAATLLEMERAVLREACCDANFLARACPVFEEYDFIVEAHRLLWRTLKQAWDQHREVASPEIVAHALLTSLRGQDPDIIEQYDSHLEEVVRGDRSTSPRADLEIIKRLAKTAILRNGGHLMFKTLDDGGEAKIDAAVEAFERLQARLRHVERLGAATGWISGIAARRRRRTLEEDRKLRVPIPGDALTKATNGGLPPGRVVLVTAPTNVGKSSVAAGFGLHALKRGEDLCVVHIVTEELLEDAENRYDAGFLEMDREKFSACEVTDDDWDALETRYQEKFPWLETQFALHAIPKYTPVDQVFGFIEDMRKAHPEKMMLVIVDSPDHIISGKKLEVRHDIANVWNRLDSAARDPIYHPLSFLLTTHATKETEGKLAKSANVSESYDKSRISHLSLSLLDQGEAKDGAHRYEVGLIKNRIGKLKNIIIPMRVDLGTCALSQAGRWYTMASSSALEDDRG